MSTTSVLYVRRPNAKAIKSLLEKDHLLDKRFRMVPTSADAIVSTCFDNCDRCGDDGSGAGNGNYVTEIQSGKCIAVPVTEECIDMLNRFTDDSHVNDEINECRYIISLRQERASNDYDATWIFHVIASGTHPCPFSTSLGNQNRQSIASNIRKSAKSKDSLATRNNLQSQKSPTKISLSNIQYALVETIISCSKLTPSNDKYSIESFREVVEQSVKSLSIKTCPKKLELIGDDKTLVVPHWAFQLEKESYNNNNDCKKEGFQNSQEGRRTEFYDLLLKSCCITDANSSDDDSSPGKSNEKSEDLLSTLHQIQYKLWENLAHVHKSTRVVRRGDIDPESGVRESGHRILYPIPTSSEISTGGDNNHGYTPKSTWPNSPGWITVTEHKISQSFDLTRVMFSRGNVTEKKRFASLVQPGECVLDMYAGIGYYTLPALVHGRAKHVTACEWNPHALNALRYNLKANGVDSQSVVLEGDCRVSLRGLLQQQLRQQQQKSPGGDSEAIITSFDRISLGLLPSCEGGWPIAIACLHEDTGGWLHVHANVPTIERDNWTHWLCRSLANIIQQDHPNRTHWHAVCTHVEKVKSFAPKVDHIVADVFVGPSDSSKMPLKENVGTGVIDSSGEFVPTAPNVVPPSCALSKDGVLHQSWLMNQGSSA